jgi:RHS repeat-associated protein
LPRLTDFAARTFTFAYDALGRRTALSRPNGVNTSYAYDPLSRLTSILHQTGSVIFDGASYTYDAAGNRTSRTTLPSNLAYSYNYDPIYELTQATLVSTGKASEKYTYDAVGDRLYSPGVPYAYNTQHEMTAREGVTYCYDANGNTLSKTTGGSTCSTGGGGGGGGVDPSYTWDFENRLTSVTPANGNVITFKYDPFGRRIYKNSASGATLYVYDGDNILEELTATGALGERYTYGPGIDEPLVGQRQPKIFYYEADGLGSITSLTDPTGAVAATYTYDSFGFLTNSTGSATNWFRYAARQFDSDTALYYNRARYYDPTTGRFLSQDPSGFKAGVNFYTYVENHPTSLIDPFGLSTLVFDRASGTLTLVPGNTETPDYPEVYGEPDISQVQDMNVFTAGNVTTNPTGDPNTIGSKGPAPNGTFPVQPPVVIDPSDTANYARYGPYEFPIGAPGSLIRKRGIGLHGGRTGPQYPTWGCIRVSNSTIKELYEYNQIDPITSITIQ